MEKPSIGNTGDGTDQRHWNREQRDQGGSPSLEENKNHKDDQVVERLPERVLPISLESPSIILTLCRVDGNVVIEVGRELTLCQL